VSNFKNISKTKIMLREREREEGGGERLKYFVLDHLGH